MAQHDYVIDNSTGANVRADINNVLQAIATNNSGSSAPSTTVATQFFADTNAGIMKLRNTANSGYVNLFTLAGGIDVDAASNFNEDVTFTGASANITFDKSSNELLFADNAKASFGNNGDLVIRHDGSSSIVEDNGTGPLNIQTNNSNINIKGGSSAGDTMAIFKSTEGVDLFYNNVKTFATKNNGIIVLGGESNNAEIEFHADEADDNADKWRLKADTNGQFEINNFASGSYERSIECNGNGNVELYFDNTLRAATVSSGFKVHGVLSTNVTSGQAISLSDNARADFGAGDDLQIFHDGSHSRIKDAGTGDLIMMTSRLQVNNAADDEAMINAVENGAVELYNDNVKVFTTTNEGATFDTGSSSCVVRFTSNNDAVAVLQAFNSDFNIKAASGGALVLQANGNEDAIKCVSNGAVELYHNGNRQVFTIDGGLNFQDNKKAEFGNSGDLKIFHDGSNSRVTETGTGHLYFDASQFIIRNAGGTEEMFVAVQDSGVKLLFDNSEKLNTRTWGVQIHGDLVPHGDNTRDLGASNERWAIVFAANGSINTSDKNEKNTILESDLGLDFVNKLKPVSYKWNKDDGKTHYGLIAQDVEKTLTSIGKTIADFGGIHKEDNSPMGLGYFELISPLIKAVQELSAKVAKLEAA